MTYHSPVMLQESVDALQIIEGGNYADVTFGGGGHSREILRRMGKGTLIAFDQDDDATAYIIEDKRFIFVPANFRYLKNYCRINNLQKLDGVLADLGVSSHQFDEAGRGFSTRFNAELDMRMDQDQELKATHVLNTYTAAALQDLFSHYGEVTNAASLTQKIIIGRLQEPILHTQQFKDLIKPLVRRGKENQYYAQVFQALRIEVNKELEALEELLLQSTEMLVTGGRLVVISYHSLEDRLIKNFFAKGKFKGEVEKDLYGNELKPYTAVFRKAQMPAAAELEENNRSRSAKLRAGEKR